VDFSAHLSKVSNEYHNRLSGGKEDLQLGYETFRAISADEGVLEIKSALIEALTASRSKDISLGYCTVGPHRDDLSISINGTDSRRFASQGQQRTIALSLKLGEVALFREEQGETPILLLDDVLSELDASRREALVALSGEVQTLMTCTEFAEQAPAAKFKVQRGTLASQS
jgi:DNA replication and repair protein RecF